MKIARWTVAAIGILLPYLAVLPHGTERLAQHLDGGIGGFLFFGAFNAIAWGSVIAMSRLYRFSVSMLFPALIVFGYLGLQYYRLDLAADVQAAVALIFIPIYAVPYAVLGGAMGYVWDRLLIRRDVA